MGEAAYNQLPRATFTALPVVWIEVRVTPVQFPKVCDPEGMVQKLREWIFENKIMTAAGPSSWGGNGLAGAFWKEDAERIAAYMRRNGFHEHKVHV